MTGKGKVTVLEIKPFYSFELFRYLKYTTDDMFLNFLAMKKINLIIFFTIIITGIAFSSSNPVLMEYYAYYMSCSKCQKTIGDIKQWSNKNSKNIVIKVYDLTDEKNWNKLEELNKKFNIFSQFPELPILFYNDKFYVGNDQIYTFLANNNAQGIEHSNFSLGIIILAGILDGMNPCVFTVIILLISYLFINLKSRKLVLISGIFYIVTVFITYFFIGLGIFGFVRMLNIFPLFSKIFKYALTIFLFVLAVLNLSDFVKLMRSKDNRGKLFLKLPDFFQNKIREAIRFEMKNYRIILSSIVLGFLVSLFEILCTGQIYFPIIGYISDMKVKIIGFIYLTLYNLAFIIPLAVIFILVYFGISSKKIGDFLGNKLGFIKLIFFCLFLAFGVINLIS